MTSLNKIIRGVMGDAFVSAQAVEEINSENEAVLWVDVVYATEDDRLEAKTMMDAIEQIKNWDAEADRAPTVNFISQNEAPPVRPH